MNDVVKGELKISDKFVNNKMTGSWLRQVPSGPFLPSLISASLLFAAYSVFNQGKSFQEVGKYVFCLFLKIFHKDIGEHITPTATNRTREGLVLVYNRVPKCSSTSMYKLVKELAVRNKFKFSLAKSNDIRNELRTLQKEKALVAALKKLPKHGAYVRHVYNPDWERLGLQVNLVNMIRDPISRMASWFYFVRFARKIFF